MLDQVLFWVVLVWMIGMLVMAFIAVREVWRDSNQPGPESESLETSPQESRPPGGGDGGR